MTYEKILSLISFLYMFTFSMTLHAQPVPVKNFDIERYQGQWHQLSAIPASFQEDCLENTTADYSLLYDRLLKVVNSCDRKNGDRKASEARARINKNFGLNSTLEVTFVKLFGWIWSLSGDYWIIYINKDYSTAIVGHPKYKYGWILSKKKSLDINIYQNLQQELVRQGYNPCHFMMSQTEEQKIHESINLCNFVESNRSTSI